MTINCTKGTRLLAALPAMEHDRPGLSDICLQHSPRVPLSSLRGVLGFALRSLAHSFQVVNYVLSICHKITNKSEGCIPCLVIFMLKF